jgi:hypothetical protein
MEVLKEMKGLKLKEVLRGLVRVIIDLKAVYILRNYGMLYEEGWWESYRKKQSIDKEGRPIPWFTYPCIIFLNERIKGEFKIFEYGSGNSTFWWAERASEVVTCEHDLYWYEKIKSDLPHNVTIFHRNLVYGGEYSKSITNFKEYFDIIVIDGRDRVSCAKNSILALKEDGVIIWDDTERQRYQEGIKFLEASGFKRIDFWGTRPIGTAKSCTSIFYRVNNCLNI